MDLRRLRAGEWMMATAGAVLIVSLFLPWYEPSSPAAPAPAGEVTAWEAFSLIDVLLLGSGAIGIALFVVTAVQRTAAVGIASDALAFLVTAPTSAVALIRVLNIPDALATDALAAGVERTPLAWLGVLAALAVPAGALVAMRDERVSKAGHPTDPTGLPVDAAPEVEVIPAPRRGASS